jgi:NAD(P)-dependent dehydrogenase (short-subunit alcohol dehydrogenase family)
MATYHDLKGKTFVVTGAASGMGRSISLALAEQGANVGLLDLNKPDHVLEEIRKLGGKALSLTCDVTKFDQVESAVKAVVKEFGALHGAANMAGYVGNQGFYGKGYAIDVLEEKDWQVMLDINLNGVRNCLKAELNNITGEGAIVNAASISAIYGPPYNAPYAVAKAGVVQLTRCSAQENGLRNIRVNAIAP